MKIKGVKIKEVLNGWSVTTHNDETISEYVYPADKSLILLEEVGKFLIGRKVKVIES